MINESPARSRNVGIRCGNPNKPRASATSENMICPANPKAIVPDNAKAEFIAAEDAITVKPPETPPK